MSKVFYATCISYGPLCEGYSAREELAYLTEHAEGISEQRFLTEIDTGDPLWKEIKRHIYWKGEGKVDPYVRFYQSFLPDNTPIVYFMFSEIHHIFSSFRWDMGMIIVRGRRAIKEEEGEGKRFFAPEGVFMTLYPVFIHSEIFGGYKYGGLRKEEKRKV